MSDHTVAGILSAVLAEGAGGGKDSLPLVLCRHAARDLLLDGAGLWIMTSEAVQHLVAATDGLARELEDLQFTAGEGPCLDAYGTDRPVTQPDLLATAPARWPAFGPAAVSAGAGAVFAFPVGAGGIRLGVLDLYRLAPGALLDEQTLTALAYADAATILLLYLQQDTPDGLDLQWEATELRREEVHQATGMVSVQASVGLTEAMLLLRARAYAENRSLGDVANDVVTRVLRFRPLDDPTDD